MIRDHLRRLVTQAIQSAQAGGDLPAFDIPTFTIERPKQANMGDYAASVAMQLARAARLAPPQIAQKIAGHLQLGDIASAEVVGGYINFRLTPEYLTRQVDAILEAGDSWGNLTLGAGQSVQVEHGSANPTGPLTVAAGRNVVIGDTLANALAAAGYRVHREWYVNDAGNQIRHFGASVYARYMQLLGHDEPFPEDGYRGDYIIDIARQIIAREGDRYAGLPRDEARRALGQIGIDAMMDSVRRADSSRARAACLTASKRVLGSGLLSWLMVVFWLTAAPRMHSVWAGRRLRRGSSQHSCHHCKLQRLRRCIKKEAARRLNRSH